MSSPLHGDSKPPLMRGAETAASPADNLSPIGKVRQKKLHLLVIRSSL